MEASEAMYVLSFQLCPRKFRSQVQSQFVTFIDMAVMVFPQYVLEKLCCLYVSVKSIVDATMSSTAGKKLSVTSLKFLLPALVCLRIFDHGLSPLFPAICCDVVKFVGADRAV